MTREEIMALEGRELDAAVAEKVMGRTVRPSVSSVGFWEIESPVSYFEGQHYSTDHNAARLVLAEIEKRGLDVTFVGVLEDIIWPEPVGIDEVGVAWGLLNATPAQICRAALLSCMEVE